MPILKGRRGHYDLVILSSDFIEANNAESITNRLLKFASPEAEKAIVATIEFKLSCRGWSNGAYKNTRIDLQKLSLNKSNLCYAVMLMRYNAPAARRWQIYWPQVCEEAEKSSVRSIFTVHWLKSGITAPNTYLFGNWQSLQTGPRSDQ